MPTSQRLPVLTPPSCPSRYQMSQPGHSAIFSPLISERTALSNANRLPFVDSLRGLAALYVVAFHTAVMPWPALRLPAWLKPWLLNGSSGVTLFFVISAFTLCLTLDGKQHEPRNSTRFYLRRLFRILPLYYVWLLIMALWKIGPNQLLVERKALGLYAVFGYNFFPKHQYGLVEGSWTLSIEMMFYAALSSALSRPCREL
jgi:peptidoglycan/LPS O-acetylase OafA/YrhL